MAKKRPKNPKGESAPNAVDSPAPGRRTARSEVGPAIPIWLPATVFVGLTVVLFRDFIFSDQMLFGSDTLGLGYVARALYADALATLGSVPGWAPDILGGTPFLEALSSGDALYPPSVLLLMLTEPYRALGWKLVVHVVAAGFFMYGWLRAIGGSKSAALLGATAYMLAPYFISLVQAGHDGKLFVTALAPLLFWAVERHFSGPQVKTVASIALVIGLIILTTHFQMAYFLFGAVGVFAIFRAVGLGRAAPAGEGGDAAVAESDDSSPTVGEPALVSAGPGPLRAAGIPFGLFLVASVLGAGVAAVQLLPAVDYVTEHSRRIQTTRDAAGESGVAWSSSWSIHPEEAVSLIIPEFSGVSRGTAAWTQNTYWGRNVFKLNHEGAGLVILLLAAVSFVGGARRSLRFFLAGLGLVSLLFALGTHTPLWGFFYAVVPGIRLFRAPSQVMFLFAFAASTLGALGLDRLLELRRERDEQGGLRALKVLGGLTGGLAVLALLAGSGMLTSAWTATIYREITEQRLQTLEFMQPLISMGAGIAFLLGAATFGVALASRAGRLPAAGVVAALVGLVAADELRVSSAFVHVLDFYEWSTPDGFTQAVLAREAASDEPYRLAAFGQRSQDVMPALAGIELAGGHHPNDLVRYRELIGMVGSGEPQNLLDVRIRRLLNIRYLMWPAYMYGPYPGPPESLVVQSQLQDGSPYESLHMDPGLPRARLVGSSVVKSDAEAVDYMLSNGFDPETEVVLAEPSPISLDGAPSDGTVQWVERSADRLELSVTTERPALLVVADNWFPAWQATVDGEEAPVLRAYHALRAVPVPAGEHTVEMVYASDVVSRSLLLSILLTIGLIGATGVQVLRERQGRVES